MITTIPVVPGFWLNGIPITPAAVGSTPLAMLVLLAMLCAGVFLMLRSGVMPGGGARQRRRPALHLVQATMQPAADAAPASRGAGAATGRDLDGYRRFLAARDGAPDLQRHRLARRESFFAALDAAPVQSRSPIDRAAFQRNLRRRQPERDVDDRMLWLLASAKANQAERFGVGFSELYGRVPTVDEDPVRVHMHLQETYHTRILADVVELFGVSVQPAPPTALNRALIKLMVLSPPRWVLPLVGCSEMVGCVIFRALRDRGVALMADEPDVAERVRLLYDEILADEISHVGYIASQLGRSGRAAMRFLYRRLAVFMSRQMPELTRLFPGAELARRFEGFRLDALLAEYPDKAYAAALV